MPPGEALEPSRPVAQFRSCYRAAIVENEAPEASGIVNRQLKAYAPTV